MLKSSISKIKIASILLSGVFVAALCSAEDNVLPSPNFSGYVSVASINSTRYETTRNDVSAEMGLEVTWDPLQHVSSAVGVRGTPGNYYDESPIDYAYVDINASVGYKTSYGVRLGRNKVIYGFYNGARVNPGARPTFILPQSAYWNVFNDIVDNIDGYQLYLNTVLTNNGNFEIIHSAGNLVASPRNVHEIDELFYHGAGFTGNFEIKKPAHSTVVRYEQAPFEVQYSFAQVEYHKDVDFPASMFVPAHSIKTKTHQVGFRVDVPNWTAVTEMLYLQPSTSLDNLQIFSRFGYYGLVQYQRGKIRFSATYSRSSSVHDGLHEAQDINEANITTDLMFSVKYNLDKGWHVIAEIHNMAGSLGVRRDLNPDFTNVYDSERWKQYVVNVGYDF